VRPNFATYNAMATQLLVENDVEAESFPFPKMERVFKTFQNGHSDLNHIPVKHYSISQYSSSFDSEIFYL